MADTPSADDIRKEMEKQISELKKEVAQLTKSLSARGEGLYDDLRESAQGYYGEASGRAKSAAKQVRQQAHMVSEAVRENPGTAATVLSSAGLFGFLIGLVVGQALTGGNHSRRWY